MAAPPAPLAGRNPREFVRDSSVLLETVIVFDGKIPVNKNSVEAEVMLKGFLLAGLAAVLKTHSFEGKKNQ